MTPYHLIEEFVDMGGCVYAGPDCFGMARQVSTAWPPEIIGNWRLENEELTGALDCWHISYASGDIQALLEKLPHPLPFISFLRDGQGELKIYNLKSFIRHGQNSRHARHSKAT